MESKTRILGHPVHQVAVMFPIGALGLAALSDGIYAATRSKDAATVAKHALTFGLVTALMAAPFGLRDWLAIPRGTRAKRVGGWHAVGNLVALGVFGAARLLRRGKKVPVAARVLSAIPMPTVCEAYIRDKALDHLEKGRVVIFAGGTGNPYFTTDTAAALRAAEMGCHALLKATQVDGVYSADPEKVPDAKRYDRLTYDDVLRQDLRIMDGAAIALARDNRIPIIVFSIKSQGGLASVLLGQGSSTLIEARGA